jgi:LuxR family transcriptional regulator, maltose regulon positive regulatory protein
MAEIPPYLKTILPVTKLHPPGGQHTIKRATLVEHLRQLVLAHRLTLVSAPAGAGKTTLAADLAQSADDLTVGWLSLDDGDNDAQLLLAIMLVTLPDIDDELIQLVSQGHIATQQIANLLVNHLDQNSAQHFVLILDDLHLLGSPDIHRFLDYMIERLPAHAHILATTRYDPPLSLAKLRARGELAEVRLDMLRFNRAEVDELLNHLLRLNIPDDLLDQMLERTEGWIAGLRLLALSLENIDTDRRATYISELTQNDRYVFELLAQEVLAQQSEDIRRFLLETSILDELTPELCQAVTQQHDIVEVLHELHRQNLFLVSVGDGTYRYHALFQDFLRQQMQIVMPDVVPQLHLRAAAACTMPGKKIQHYIAAQSWDDVISVIDRFGKQVIEQSNRKLVQQWLDALPDSAQNLSGWTIHIKGVLAYHRGEFESAMQTFEAAEAKFRQEGNTEGVFEAILMHNAANENDDHLETQLEYARRAEPFVTNDRQRLYIELMMAWAYLFEGYRSEAEQHFLTTMRLIERLPESLEFVGFQIAPPVALAFADVALLKAGLTRLLNRFELDNRVLGATTHIVLAQVALWLGDLEQARAALDRSRTIWKRLGGATHLHKRFVNWMRIQLALIAGDDDSVDRLSRDARDRPMGVMNYAMMRARWSWLRGDAVEARYILTNMPSQESLAGLLVEGVYRLSVQALLDAQDARAFRETETLLVDAIRRQQHGRYSYSLFCTDLRVTLAYCYYLNGETDLSLETMAQVLRDYEQMNLPGRVAQEGPLVEPLLKLAVENQVCADFAQRALAILQVGQPSGPVSIPGTHETLTPREVEVLRLIVDGVSNRAIAETLVIAEPTVKTHITRILGKLNARSRTEAVARVRELRLSL